MTPVSKQKPKGFVTPRKQARGNASVSSSAALTTPAAPTSASTSGVPITPEITPLRSARKKRVHVDDITSENPVNKFARSIQTAQPPAPVGSEFAFGLLLPVASTVGSGRKMALAQPHSFHSVLKPAPSIFDFANIAHEEDMEDDDASRSFMSDKNIKLMLPINYDQPPSPTKSKAAPSAPAPAPTASAGAFQIPTKLTPIIPHTPKLLQTPKLPQTPVAQLIDDDIIFKWHGKSFNNDFSTDEESILQDNIEMDDEDPFAAPLNPFLTSSLKLYTPFRAPPTPKRNNIDYSTHMELVNNKTGERKIVALLAEQAAIKPRKLDFSSFK